MKLKRMLNILTLGTRTGFIFGLGKALGIISSNKYFHYELHRLILFELTGRINNGILYGLVIAISFCLLLTTLLFLWRKILSKIIEVKIIRKNKLAPLIKGTSSLLLFAYLILKIVEFSRSLNHNLNSFLCQSSVILLVFFFLTRLEKISSFFSRSGISSYVKRFGMKIAFGTALSIFLLLNIITFSQRLFSRPSGPNILLIVADALRPDHLGCYGYDRPTSPYIDKFAADAVVFEKAMSNSSWTLPSIGNMLTSLYPHEHTAFHLRDSLPDECLTLAELFRDKNYRTFAIQTNPCISKIYNFSQGFQYYQELLLEKGDKVVNEFNARLKNNKNKPFFAYLHFMDTHLQYDPPEELKTIFEPEKINSSITGLVEAFIIRVLGKNGLPAKDRQHLMNLYDAEIRFFDYCFGLIIDNLNKFGISDKTMVILAADHGEEFWEHNSFEHGHSLYNEVLNVPLIIKCSTKLPAKRIKYFVQLIDLFPSLLNIAQIKKDFVARGKDFLPSILNNKPIKEEIFIEGIKYGSEKIAILRDGWKLIYDTGIKSEKSSDPFGDLIQVINPEHKEEYELYNIEQDFSEKSNLMHDFHQIATRLKMALLKFRINAQVLPKEKKTKLKEKLEDLKTLGYIK
jgi:arylsulfatase A-like enzyme